jgi:hypothetical protein
VDIFLHAANLRIMKKNNEVEMWMFRMSVCNAIVDPWLYIVLRKESLRKIILFYRRYGGKPKSQQLGEHGIDETTALLQKY